MLKKVLVLTIIGGSILLIPLVARAADPTPTQALENDLIKSLTVQDTVNAPDWSLQVNLQVGNVQYGDRTYQLAAIPAQFTGQAWIRTAADSKNYTLSPLVTFTAKKNLDVYIAHDDRTTSKPAWMTGWTDTGFDVVNNSSPVTTQSLLKKSFLSDAQVSLGSNGSTTNPTYSVILVPQSCLAGDINCDGTIDSQDLRAILIDFDTLNTQLDQNLDSKINSLDFAMVAAKIRPAASPSPSPTAGLVAAFPGAQGFGTATAGGRGGIIIEVTNTNQSGPGSLKAAIDAVGPRIVVFRVGGIIRLRDNPTTSGNDAILKITNPYITIAGQTAPGDGIAIRGGTLRVSTHDVIVRNLRFRVGDDLDGYTSTSRDGIDIAGSSSGSDVYNVVIDHSSVSWGVDENISTWTNKVHDVTLSWNISSEALYDSIHVDEGQPPGVYDIHSMGMLIGDYSHRISVHHNLIAHSANRTPVMSDNTATEFINNVSYNWGGGQWPIKFNDSNGSGLPLYGNTVNNIFKRGVHSTSASKVGVLLDTNLPSMSRVYVQGNLFLNQDGTPFGTDIVLGNTSLRSVSPIVNSRLPASQVSVDNSADVLNKVLNRVGAIAPRRDVVDEYVTNTVRAGTGTFVDCIVTCNEPSDRRNFHQGFPEYSTGIAPTDTDHDSMPDAWETGRGLDPNDSSDGNTLAPSKYTWVEEYINSLI